MTGNGASSSQQRDQSDAEKTDSIPIVTSASGIYSTAPRPEPTISSMLAGCRCVAVLSTALTIVYVLIEQASGQVGELIILLPLLTTVTASWTATAIIAARDLVIRHLRSISAGTDTTQTRIRELRQRQDFLSQQLLNLAHRQAEQLRILNELTDNVRVVRGELDDALTIADADQELTERRAAVNGNVKRAGSGGMYLVTD